MKKPDQALAIITSILGTVNENFKFIQRPSNKSLCYSVVGSHI